MSNFMRHKKRRRKRKGRARTPGDRHEGDLPELSNRKLDLERSDVGNPYNIPSGMRGISNYEESTVAWIKANCKFARGMK